MIIPALDTFTINRQLINQITPDIIKYNVIKHYNGKLDNYKEMPYEDLKILVESKVRVRPIPHIRNTCYYLLKQVFPMLSLKEIGNYFSSRDHSTVIHGITTYTNDCETSKETFDIHTQLCKNMGITNKIQPIFKVH